MEGTLMAYGEPVTESTETASNIAYDNTGEHKSIQEQIDEINDKLTQFSDWHFMKTFDSISSESSLSLDDVKWKELLVMVMVDDSSAIQFNLSKNVFNQMGSYRLYDGFYATSNSFVRAYTRLLNTSTISTELFVNGSRINGYKVHVFYK